MMTLKQLFPDCQGDDVVLSGLALDSREVKPGYLFLAVPGLRSDGRQHVVQALAAGAAAVAYEAEGFTAPAAGVPMLPVKALASQLSAIAGRFYQEPSSAMALIGITGTNGKTSVSQMLAQALSALGQPCGIIGTLGSGMPGALQEHGMTTPDALRVQQQLASLRESGARAVSMEVSSHALDQGRVAAVHFDLAVFTNLSRDHLDYHGDMASYGAAKARLFERPLRGAVINADDAFGRELASGCQVPVIEFSVQNRSAALYCSEVRYDSRGIQASVHYQGAEALLKSELLGAFNLSNLLAVVGSLLMLGYNLSDAVEQVAAVRAPEGRMQRLGGAGQPLVVVDYAHTPDALEKALTALKVHAEGHLTCIFGCGGDRDSGKRPLMGQAAERGADRLVVTDDNPRGEASERIIEQICQGIERKADLVVIANRSEAIKRTIATAAAGDLILLAGKGHENYQEIAGVRYPFSDIEQARQALQQWGVQHA